MAMFTEEQNVPTEVVVEEQVSTVQEEEQQAVDESGPQEQQPQQAYDPAAAQLQALQAQMAQQANIIQQQQMYLQVLAQQRMSSPGQTPSEVIKPDDFFADPEKSSEAVAARVVDKMIREKIGPIVQHYASTYQDGLRNAAVEQYNGIIKDANPAVQAFLQNHKAEFDQTLATLPIDTLAKPGAVRDVMNWVRMHHEDQVQNPVQPTNVGGVPRVSTKVTSPGKVASMPNRSGARLSEDEAKEAKKQGLSTEEYIKYRDEVYG